MMILTIYDCSNDCWRKPPCRSRGLKSWFRNQQHLLKGETCTKCKELVTTDEGLFENFDEIVGPDFRGGLKGWTTGLKDGIILPLGRGLYKDIREAFNEDTILSARILSWDQFISSLASAWWSWFLNAQDISMKRFEPHHNYILINRYSDGDGVPIAPIQDSEYRSNYNLVCE